MQRVREAAVEIAEVGGGVRVVGEIGVGILVLVGFGREESAEGISWMAGKVADLRIFGRDAVDGGGFERSVREVGGEVLVVSQFTLYGEARKGRRPDFGRAAPYGEAEAWYKLFCETCRVELPGRVQTGEFGASMAVRLVNDGPVTLWLER
ncbi:MAG: D-aminoacyl-tRNA deacylase [Gemmatimonadota bacterium]